MITDTGNRIMSRSSGAHELQSNSIGIVSIAFAVVSLVMLVVPETRALAWLPAVPAVVVAAIALSRGAGRKRYSTAGLVFGWVGFSFSFAMMVWG